MGKEENAGYQHFLLFPQFFKGLCLPPVCQKSSLCGNGLTCYQVNNLREYFDINLVLFMKMK